MAFFILLLSLFSSAIFGLSLFVRAAPVLRSRQAFKTLSTAEMAAFRPFSHYASTGYCQPSQTLTWTCGPNCDANPQFQPVASGGDGKGVQFWYVGFDPDLKTIVVAHQGTDPSELMPLLTDADFVLDDLDTSLFPGISSDIKVHNGFAEEHAKTAADVLAAVSDAMDKSGFTDVHLVGHSLGAALALLDGVFLPMNLPNATFTTIGYGMPRVGNQEFANFVDANVKLTRVTNKNDFVPILPGRFLGFRHPSGENHIQADESWVACPGQDNADARCSTGDVKNVFVGSVGDHSGPYDGVKMGC